MPAEGFALLHTALAGFSDGFVRLDREGRVREAGGPAARLVGGGPGRPPASHPPPGDELFERLVRLAADPAPARFEAPSPALGGWWEVLAYPFPEGLTAYLRDVTPRKQEEGALRAAEERFRLLVEGTRDYAIILLGPDGHVTSWTPGAERMDGYEAREILGRHYACFFPTEDVRAGKPEKCLRAARARGQLEYQGWRVRKDGSRFWADVLLTALDDGAGRLRAFSEVTRDASERKHLEQRVTQAQKMEAIGRLAGGVAHDFNNLLTAILGYSELALDSLHAGDPLRELLEEVRKAGHRAADLTRQLLAFSRQQTLAPRVLDLGALVADMEKMLRRLIGEDVQLVTALAPGLGLVKADPSQIEQVLMNLAVNARDAMPWGGKLVIETANVQLDEAYAAAHAEVRPGRYVLLAVSDTGEGMDEETRHHIFEPFFTTKESGKGTGLGLATVYGILRQSGGSVSVYSEPGRGTTFKVYLPRVEEAGPAPPARPGIADLPLGNETLLLVEDEDAVRALARTVLQTAGYHVLEARQGSEALALGEQHAGRIDLLVTDVVMPQMSGRDLADRLAALQPDFRVLYLSGYPVNAIAQHGVLEPGTAFLQKPFTPGQLARKVREVLDTAAARVVR
jgi:PAS domain S-box-containing protein